MCDHKHTKRIAIALICTQCHQVLKNKVSPKKPKHELDTDLSSSSSSLSSSKFTNYSISPTVTQNIHDNLHDVYSLPLFTNLTPPDSKIRDDILHIFSHICTLSRAKTTSTYAFYFMTVVIHTICDSQHLNIVDVANYVCKKHKNQVKSFKYNMHMILKYSKYHTRPSFYRNIICYILKEQAVKHEPHEIDNWTNKIVHFEDSFIVIRESIGQKKVSINTFKVMTSYIPIYIHEQLYDNTSISDQYADTFIINKSKATIIRIKSDLRKVLKSS